MKKKKLLLRLVVLVAAMMCAFGASAAEAYACYTPSNTTLTFYYDSQRSTRPGRTYSMNTEPFSPDWYSDSTCRSVTNVVFNSSFVNARPTSTRRWFSTMVNLTSITNLPYLHTEYVTNMQEMFSFCRSLTSLNMSYFSTAKVTDMYCMFERCSALTSLDLSSFNTANVTDMGYMFLDCSNLTSLDLSSFNTAKVTNMQYMFCQCSSLTSLDVSHFNTAQVTSMYFMFSYCSGLTSLDVTSFNTSNVTNMLYMFNDCSSLTSLDVSRFNTAKVTNMEDMFGRCSGLTSLDVRNFNTANVTNMQYMFSECTGLKTLDLRSFNTAKVAKMNGMFRGNSNLMTIFVGSGWSTNAVTSSDYMFSNCTKLVGGMGTTYDANHEDVAYAHIDGGPNNPGYFTAAGTEAYACYTPSDSTLTFYYDNQRNFRMDTTYSLNPDSWLTDPRWVYISPYITQVVFDPSFAVFRPANTYRWFRHFEKLQSITGIEYLNTSNVSRMDYMFDGCSALTSLDLSHFNTSSLTRLDYMFRDCSNLTSLDLSSFNTANVRVMVYMFYGCSALTTIYAGDEWSTDAVSIDANNSRYMFTGCTSLVGGKGTTYDPDHVNAAYAHIDGGPNNPGYFTAAGTGAYACYTPSNTTLTFYYDNLRSTRPGSTYDLNTVFELPGWIMDWLDMENHIHPATQVVFDPSFAAARPIATSYWFLGMSNLQSITGLSYLNTSEVINMSSMFNNCSGLTSLDLSGFNTAKVAYMESMFLRCSGLTSLDLSSFNTANVGDMSGMFEDCTGLTSLDLGSFNTARAAFIPYMFNRCSNLTTIYAGSGWNLPADGYTEGMFNDCVRLVGGKGTTYDPNHVDGTYAHIDGGPNNPGYLTDANAVEAYAVYTEDNTTLTFYCDNQRRFRPGTAYDLNSGVSTPGWCTDSTYASVTQAVFDPSFANARPTTTWKWFYQMDKLESIEGISNLNTSEVTRMNYMFFGCYALTSLDVSGFNTSNVTSMSDMFNGCYSLTSLDVSGFNTAKVLDMGYMFLGCRSLTSLDVSGFNTSNVTHMNGIFGTCSSLKSLDLSSFNTSNVTNMYFMFGNCTNITTIYVGSGWSTAAVTSSNSMFQNCVRLVGGQGTTWNSSNPTDKTYARIDGGPNNPGYFTYKNVVQHGDVDGNGNVNTADVSALINLLLTGGTPSGDADANQDGIVNTSDIAALINYLLSGSWPSKVTVNNAKPRFVVPAADPKLEVPVSDKLAH